MNATRKKFHLSLLSVLLAFLVASGPCAFNGWAQAPSTVQVRPAMDQIYDAFRSLQKYLFRREAFLDPQNEQSIKKLLLSLREGFHKVKSHDSSIESRLSSDPGFGATLTTMSDMLEDATLRFSEGNKPYALWRVKSAAQYCVACHTRHKVELDFYDQDPGLSALSVAEQADFYLATRQFERARLLFLDAARAASASYKRLESLRSWLLIAVRVDSDSARAISELTKFRSQVTLSEIEDSELVSWLESLRRWKNESVRLEIDPLTRAKNLIAQGKGLNDPLSGRSGTVELLRATALLHGYLESDGHHVPTERGEGLLLLGEAYQELSISMPGELPEIFFEQCVREFPGSAQAREAFDRYEELVALSFTGSGGVRIPDDVQRGIDELKRLAHGAGGEKQ